MLFLACSIFSSKTSQSATTRAGVFFAIIVDTKVPRLPVPSTPAVIAEFAGEPVIASDIFHGYAYGIAPIDFVYDSPLVKADWVITHPPFNLACDFTLRALDLATEGVAMLIRTQWMDSMEQYDRLFRDRPPTIYAPFVERVPMAKGRWDPDAATATSYAWFVWRHLDRGKPTRISWIPPDCRERLTKSDDRSRIAAWLPEPAPTSPPAP